MLPNERQNGFSFCSTCGWLWPSLDLSLHRVHVRQSNLISQVDFLPHSAICFPRISCLSAPRAGSLVGIWPDVLRVQWFIGPRGHSPNHTDYKHFLSWQGVIVGTLVVHFLPGFQNKLNCKKTPCRSWESEAQDQKLSKILFLKKYFWGRRTCLTAVFLSGWSYKSGLAVRTPTTVYFDVPVDNTPRTAPVATTTLCEC